MTVDQILSEKGNEVCTVLPTITVYDALAVMCEKNIGAVLVVENGVLKGIFSERDYARKIVLKAKTSKSTIVSEVMVNKVITVKSSDNIDCCMELMHSKKIRHLPVIEDGKIVGIVSMGDVVKGVIDTQKHTIQHLDRYISGSKE